MTEPSATNLEQPAAAQAPGPATAGGPARAAGRPGSWALAAVLVALALVLTLKDIGDGGFRHSDASRHAMDGVFVHDFVRDLPRSACHPVDYTLSYYAQYPALGIMLYYPPFFAVVEAVFFALFGISPFSARLTVVFFTVLAVLMMYKLLKAMFHPRVAFVATALFLALPIVVFWSRQVMLEMPTAAMVLTACYFFHRYVEEDHRRSALWTGLFAVLAVMTKQPALFVLPAFGLYVLVRRKWKVFTHWQLYAALALVAAALVPFFYLTFRYAHYLTAGLGGSAAVLKDKGGSVLVGWRQAFAHQFPILGPWLLWSFLACGGACLAIELVRPRHRGILLLVLLVAVYFLQSVYLGAGGNRYVFIILPMLAVFAPLLLERLGLLRFRAVTALACGGVLALAVVSYLQPIPIKRGYEQAVQSMIGSNGTGTLILFDGYWDGDVVFFTRQKDPDRRLCLLRGSKMLYSFASFENIDQMVLVHDRQELLKLIHDYGIHVVAVEEADISASLVSEHDQKLHEVKQMLRQTLRDQDHFALVASTAIVAPGERLDGMNVLVYTVRQPATATAKDLIIPMVGLRLAVKVPLDRRGKPEVISLPGRGES